MKIQVVQNKIQLNWINTLCYLVFIVFFFSCRNEDDAKMISIDENTGAKCEYTIEKKQRNGLYNCFYKNGSKKEEGKYVNGQLDGIVKEYYENGILKSETEYKLGYQDGLYKSYYNNGKLYGKVTYKNGIRVGFYERFDSLNQKLILRVEYIPVPKEQEDYKFNDYANRIWVYIDGDTTLLSVDSDAYSIKSDKDRNGIIIKSHFSNNSTNDNKLDKVFLLIGDSVNKDTIDLNYIGQKRVEYNYTYKTDDVKRGWIQGVIVGTDIYNKKVKEDSSVVYSNNRRLYFHWSIKDEKVINF